MLSTNILALFKNKAKFVLREIKVCLEHTCLEHTLATLGEPTIVIMNLGTSVKPYMYINPWTSIQGDKKELKIVYATIRKFSHGDGIQQAWREEELQSDRLTRKAFSGLLRQKDFNTSLPPGK